MTRFLLIGDFESGASKRLERNVRKQKFDYVLCTGDIAEGKEQRKYIFSNFSRILAGEHLEEIIGKCKFDTLAKKDISSFDKSIKFLNKLYKRVYMIKGNWDIGLDSDAKRLGLKRLNNRLKKSNIKIITRLKNKDFILLCNSGYRGEKEKKKGKSKKWNKRLRKLFAHDKATIFLAHDPPFGVMDKINNKESPLNGIHIGDEYYTKYIKKYKPLVMVCGHMHEYQGKKRLGKTWVINPGSAAKDKFAILDIQGNKIKKIRFFK